VESDGTASDALFRLAGGAAALTEYLQRLGVAGMTIAATEAEMSRDEMVQYTNSATPRAASTLLSRLYRGAGVSSAARAVLLADLAASTPGPRRLKGLLPAGTPVAHKTGTDGTRNGLTRATNDIGLITLPDGRHLAIAVFVKDSTADEPTREATIAKIARAAYDAWSTR
jgi:beta-lactamase class A